MSTKKKYGVDSRAKAAAECYIALESAQSSISILIGVPDAMRTARYTTDESKDKTLQVQVRREVERIKRDNVDPAPLNPASLPTVAATATSHTAGTRRRSETVTNAAATTGTTVGLALDINELVTSPLRKIRKTSAQAQVEKENKKKVKAVQNRAHARATALVAEERVKEKSIRRSTEEIIAFVVEETELKNPGYKVSLCKSTINKYVANGGGGEEQAANLNVWMTVMMVEHIKKQTQQSTNKL
jgi:hypothetical protein